jgi:sugar (pentulose or hexulose) kinase
MPGQPAVLGIDLGTSQVKALLCAPDGAVLGQGTAGYEVSTPRAGWAETDPEHWWQATRTAVRQHLAWRQLLADALAVPLYPSGNGWLTARGAARIAATATGMVPGQAGRPAREVQGIAGRAELAEAGYRRFRSSASHQSP